MLAPVLDGPMPSVRLSTSMSAIDVLIRGPGAITDDDRVFFVKLGARIAALRQEHGLTQAQLAAALDVSQQTVNAFERGTRRVPVSTLPPLARTLRVSIEELVGDGAKPQSKRGPAPRLQQQLEQIRQLPKAKQKFVEQMLDAVLAQARA